MAPTASTQQGSLVASLPSTGLPRAANLMWSSGQWVREICPCAALLKSCSSYQLRVWSKHPLAKRAESARQTCLDMRPRAGISNRSLMLLPAVGGSLLVRFPPSAT